MYYVKISTANISSTERCLIYEKDNIYDVFSSCYTGYYPFGDFPCFCRYHNICYGLYTTPAIQFGKLLLNILQKTTMYEKLFMRLGG